MALMPVNIAWIAWDRPLLLAGLVAAGAPWALLAWNRRTGREAGVAAAAMQCVAVALIVAALAGPRATIGGRGERAWLVLRDVSGSVRGQRDPLNLPPDVRTQRFEFAASVATAGGDAGSEAKTDLPAALRLAAARADGVAGVVLATDGHARPDSWAPAARRLGDRGVHVLVVPLAAPPPDARIADVSARREGRRIRLTVSLSTNAPMIRRLLVTRGGERIREEQLRLLPGRPTTVRLVDEPDGPAVYGARLAPADDFPENDDAETTVEGTTRRIAFVSADPAWLPDGLDPGPGVKIVSIDAGRSPRWSLFAAVVVADVTGELLLPDKRARLAEAVRGGVGLVLIGAGPHGEPTDRADPLNRVAALAPDPWRRRPLDVVVVLDASGSMAEPTAAAPARLKFDDAAQAVLSLRRHLVEGDALTVIVFSDRPRTIYETEPAGIDYAALRRGLAEVSPAGPTDVAPALRSALARRLQLRRDRLVLLVSDLQTADFNVAALADGFRERDASLAVVATRSDDRPSDDTSPLAELARLLDAPLVERDRLTGLAEVFAQFLRGARGDVLRAQGAPFVISTPAPPFGLDLPPWPDLSRYVLAAPVGKADVLARIGPDPVLARRRAGLGRSVSFALWQPTGQGGGIRNWTGWPELLAAAVRWVARPGADPRFTGEVIHENGALRVKLTALDDGRPINDVNLELLTGGAEGDAAGREPFRQTAPGVYEVRLDLPDQAVNLRVRDHTGAVVWSDAVSLAGPGEYRHIGGDREALRRLAELTGGRLVSRNALASWVTRVRGAAATPLWPFPLAAGLGVMLVEWAVRRLRRPR